MVPSLWMKIQQRNLLGWNHSAWYMIISFQNEFQRIKFYHWNYFYPNEPIVLQNVFCSSTHMRQICFWQAFWRSWPPFGPVWWWWCRAASCRVRRRLAWGQPWWFWWWPGGTGTPIFLSRQCWEWPGQGCLGPPLPVDHRWDEAVGNPWNIKMLEITYLLLVDNVWAGCHTSPMIYDMSK